MSASTSRAAEPSNLLDLTPAAARATLGRWASGRGLPGYRAGQMLRRLWQAPVARWADATELPLELRADLDLAFPLFRLAAEVEQVSSDGTRKYLWRLADGEAVESVLIPSGSRRTLCISSQAGCALRCSFCATGRMGYRRNLSTFEIAGQVREIALRDPADLPTNVVFMGMGEPLLNWPAVDATLTILNDRDGFGIGARHITVSTVGILPGMAASPGGRSSSGWPSRSTRRPRPAAGHHADREEVRSRGGAAGRGGVPEAGDVRVRHDRRA